MICFLFLFITLQSHSMGSNVVSEKTQATSQIVTTEGTPTKQSDLEVAGNIRSHVADFAKAVQLAMRSLLKHTFLYENVADSKLPPTIESINILNAEGRVIDSTVRELIGNSFPLPSSDQVNDGKYFIQFETIKGTYWILIKTKTG